MDKIALLFLTRKELNHPRIWQKFLEEAEERYSLYIHSKEEMEDPFFRSFRISTIVPTDYLYHGKAWQMMIREALKEERNVKFIYLSESCTPLYSLSEIYHYLIRDPDSYMRHGPPWWARDSEREIVEIPIEHRWGNAEWIILNRRHASIIAEDCEILPLASKHMNSDHEGYPSSLFSIRGCLDEVIFRQTTYANFRCPKGPFPYHFRDDSDIEENYIFAARRAGSLFARKFTPEFPSERLLSIASEKLLPKPSSVADLSDELQKKITLLQALEEMSQANLCVLLPMLLNEGFFEVGYEIGVGVGLHIERIQQSASISQLYGVDDYRRNNYEGISFNEEEEDQLYRYTVERLDASGTDVQLIRSSSFDVAKKILDRSVDFIYFNTIHLTDSVEDLLKAWFPKLKEGGVIAGHQMAVFYPHLQREVKQFFSQLELEVHQERVEPKLWWVQI